MENYRRMQFDTLLAGAGDQFIDRIVQRCAGQDEALRRLRADPEGDGVWLSDFVSALFAEHCLDDPAGHCFVLEALARRPAPASADGSDIAALLGSTARAAFADLLRTKVIESMERASSFGVVR